MKKPPSPVPTLRPQNPKPAYSPKATFRGLEGNVKFGNKGLLHYQQRKGKAQSQNSLRADIAVRLYESSRRMRLLFRSWFGMRA